MFCVYLFHAAKVTVIEYILKGNYNFLFIQILIMLILIILLICSLLYDRVCRGIYNIYKRRRLKLNLDMRTKNSIINLIVAWGTQAAIIILNFINRTIFIKYLDTSYLGLNGLFGNILLFLSFAELGFGAAITVGLYKPLEENDEEQIMAIMNFFKKVYLCVGTFVFIIGTIITPFIGFFIKDIPDNIPYIHFIYLLNVFDTAISYFFTYKATLLIADQKKYVVSANTFTFRVICMFVQIISLVLYKNYIIYLIIHVITTVITNISISIIANRKYTFLRKKSNIKLFKDKKNEIIKNVSATTLHKIGAVIIFGTDNILISKLFGLISVGLYSNYYMIISTLTGFVGQIQESVIASVGNLGVTSDEKEIKEVFEQYLFIIFWIFGFTSICMFCLFNPFIKIWIGEKYLFDVMLVFVLVFNYFLTGFRSAAATFDNAFGLFWNTRFLPIVEGVLNIILSVVFAKCFGLIGIFLGTMVSSLCTGLFVEPYVLYKYRVKESFFEYIKLIIFYFTIYIWGLVITYGISNQIVVNGVISFILKTVIVMTISNLIFCVILYKNKNFSFVIGLIKKIFSNINLKIRDQKNRKSKK